MAKVKDKNTQVYWDWTWHTNTACCLLFLTLQKFPSGKISHVRNTPAFSATSTTGNIYLPQKNRLKRWHCIFTYISVCLVLLFSAGSHEAGYKPRPRRQVIIYWVTRGLLCCLYSFIPMYISLSVHLLNPKAHCIHLWRVPQGVLCILDHRINRTLVSNHDPELTCSYRRLVMIKEIGRSIKRGRSCNRIQFAWVINMSQDFAQENPVVITRWLTDVWVCGVGVWCGCVKLSCTQWHDLLKQK